MDTQKDSNNAEETESVLENVEVSVTGGFKRKLQDSGPSDSDGRPAGRLRSAARAKQVKGGKTRMKQPLSNTLSFPLGGHGKNTLYTTGIGFAKKSMVIDHLYDVVLAQKCKIIRPAIEQQDDDLSPKTDVPEFQPLTDLAFKITSRKLKNGFVLIPCETWEIRRYLAFVAEKLKQKLDRVLIIDCSNETSNRGGEDFFYEDPSVLVIVVEDVYIPAKLEKVGGGPGVGFNICIGMKKRDYKDADYLALFRSVVLPIARQFNPDFVLLSAARSRQLGGISSSCYGCLLRSFLELAGGNLIVTMDRYLNPPAVRAEFSEVCVRTLLSVGHKKVEVDSAKPYYADLPSTEMVNSLKEVIAIQVKYWSCLKESSSYIDITHHDYLLRKETWQDCSASKTSVTTEESSTSKCIGTQELQPDNIPEDALQPTEEKQVGNPITLEDILNDEGDDDLERYTEEKDIGTEGGLIQLWSHEVSFPPQALHDTIRTKISISTKTTNLNLPENLIPISHVMQFKPGHTTLNKPVTITMPVWFKQSDTSFAAGPLFAHVYSYHEGGEWEHETPVRLKTSEKISFDCKHFCKKLIAIHPDDVERGEFGLDYFLCVSEQNDNFLSCHCLATDLNVDKLKRRAESGGYKIKHPPLTRLSVRPTERIPVNLKSKHPQRYIFLPEGGRCLLVDKAFCEKNRYEAFNFVLDVHNNNETKKVLFIYKVGQKEDLLCQCINKGTPSTSSEPSASDMDQESEKSAPKVVVNVSVKDTKADVATSDQAQVNMYKDSIVVKEVQPRASDVRDKQIPREKMGNISNKSEAANIMVKDNAQANIGLYNCRLNASTQGGAGDTLWQDGLPSEEENAGNGQSKLMLE